MWSSIVVRREIGDWHHTVTTRCKFLAFSVRVREYRRRRYFAEWAGLIWLSRPLMVKGSCWRWRSFTKLLPSILASKNGYKVLLLKTTSYCTNCTMCQLRDVKKPRKKRIIRLRFRAKYIGAVEKGVSWGNYKRKWVQREKNSYIGPWIVVYNEDFGCKWVAEQHLGKRFKMTRYRSRLFNTVSVIWKSESLLMNI